ncbi:(2Fe-2S)-binding protein [Nocardioides sp. 1609]|uniref:(2Fe-2S)-binding protein n=1 Tax=Nocardioides sp. 1609 TaxID=2508327 RepID=UPI001FD67B58|nr:(2Fe-2S)-binding protein [Nocardioides sp. 1609]
MHDEPMAADSQSTRRWSRLTRRTVLQLGGAVAAVGSVGAGMTRAVGEASAAVFSRPRSTLDVVLKVNGVRHRKKLEARVTLLDALREDLNLTGTKKGCDRGACGACTVISDGRRIKSCMTLAAMQDGAEITTVEGLATGDRLHPVQEAFVQNDGLQCGFCTSGQVMSAVGLIKEGHAGSDAEIREWMSGNLCRCSCYPNIVAAIREAAEQMS